MNGELARPAPRRLTGQAARWGPARASAAVALVVLATTLGALADEGPTLEEALAGARARDALLAVLFVDGSVDGRALVTAFDERGADRARFRLIRRSVNDPRGRLGAEARALGVRRAPTLVLLDPWADGEERVLDRVLGARDLPAAVERAVVTARDRGHPPPAAGSGFVRWRAWVQEAVCEAGGGSALELTDDALVALAETALATHDLPPSGRTRDLWRTLLSRCRREDRTAVTLTAFWATHDWTVDGDHVAGIVFRARGVAVQLVPARADDALRSHEAGHAALHAVALRAGERLAQAALRPLERLPRARAAELDAAAGRTLDAVIALEDALQGAFDRATAHAGDRQVAERLGAAARRLLERDAAAAPPPALDALVEQTRRRLDALRTEADIAALERSAR